MKDNSAPEFWDELYDRRATPWDFGGVPAALLEFLSREKPGRVLVPGCGTGREVRAFAQAGWDVLAVDFSIEAVQLARETLGEYGHLVVHGDFFALEDKGYDLIYERAFLCALPTTIRAAWASKISHLLRSGGTLTGFFFFGPEDDDPPPAPLAPDELPQLLGPDFTCVEDAPVSDSLPFFVGKERWQSWRRT